MKEESENKKKFDLHVLVRIIKDTVRGFIDDDVMRLSGSLAYATLFSLIPFLSLLITIGTILNTDISNQIYSQLQPVLGIEVVDQLRAIVQNAEETDSSTFAAIVTLGITVFGATAIFTEIQSSLNTIWGIKPVPKKSWLKYIKNRLLSFSIILVFAFILLVTFTITNIITNLSGMLMYNYPEVAESFVKLVGVVINLIVTSSIFVLIFKVLPDAKIRSKDVLIGAVVTTILFMIGQWAISLYIGIVQVGTVYGAAAFMVVLITWIYYSAIILYIGAEFTEAWANKMGGKIFPDEFAVTTKIIEIHEDKPLETINKIEIDRSE